MELEKYQSIITKYNVDEYGNPVSIDRTEEQQIHPLKALIETNIIDEFKGFDILNKTMYQVYNYDDIKNATQYYVDYARGRVFFHSALKGSAIKYRYGDKGQDLLSATRIFTRLDDKGNVVELLSDLIDQTREYIAILGTFEQATVIIKKLEQTISTANSTKSNLEQAIANAQSDIDLIESTGNETITIDGSKFKYNSSSKMYECTVTHTCYSEDLHVTCKSMSTKDALFLPWRTIDQNNILLKSDVAESVIVTISARYYKATDVIQSSIVEEVKNARQSKATLLDNMNRKINYEDFNGNTIN